ncbi:hypothetical protein SAMN05444679_103130 [Variovorax sp. CF079]|uniref:hypothetical protein n=1 Tax=Variovorax sp. CF079 TaxID=1882774 RepID=UPI00087EB80C|nr:hypothetical protein [Variovorax sp. CF079]SDC46196.1 hypothetical protein SAMN05444679_103130 [Variovorax sp. CF079]
MTLKELAHAAHRYLQAQAGCDLRRSHVYELLAAALGYNSWAAFHSDSLLADAGVGAIPEGALPRIFGRARQLEYAQPAAVLMARALVEQANQWQLGAVRWRDLDLLLRPTRVGKGVEDDDDDWGTEPGPPVIATTFLTQERLLTSPLLLDSLARATAHEARAHHVLAALHRCAKPNPYLYEESRKGRVLTTSEQRWVDEYLRLEPRYRSYEQHLKAAAEGGVRAAALEYGLVFERPEFITLAERLEGDVDAFQMARSATTPQARSLWLRKAAEAGSWPALEQLADEGDSWAEERVAVRADAYWLRSAAQRALGYDDVFRAWTWQYVALARGDDLTRSTLAARHAEGAHAGQFYDSDFGGPLYVDGNEGLVLPELSRAEHKAAKAKARDILRL